MIDDPRGEYDDPDEVRDLAFDAAGACARSIENLAAMAFDRGQRYRFADWATANLETDEDLGLAPAPTRLGEVAEPAPRDESSLFAGLNLWGVDEDPRKEMRRNDLGRRFSMGRSVRHGMDYVTVDKDAFEVDADEPSGSQSGEAPVELVLLVRIKRPPGAGTMWEEYSTLGLIKERGGRAAEVLEVGYVVMDDGLAHPAFLMKRYFLSSKTIVRRVSGDIVRPSESRHALEQAFATRAEAERGLESLAEIGTWLRKTKLFVDDIQFLIDDDGSFVINDASETGRQHQAANLEVIQELTDMIEARLEHLRELESASSSSSSSSGGASEVELASTAELVDLAGRLEGALAKKASAARSFYRNNIEPEVEAYALAGAVMDAEVVRRVNVVLEQIGEATI